MDGEIEDAAAVPERYWWLKRVFILLVTLLAGIGVLWWAWARSADAAIARQVAVIRAHGEPVFLDEINWPVVFDDQNALRCYEKAIAAIEKTGLYTPRESNLRYPNYPPYPPAWHTMIDEAMSAMGEGLEWVRKARPFDAIHKKPSGKIYDSYDPSPLSNLRRIANVVADASEYAHWQGDDAQAIERIGDLLHLARQTRRKGDLMAYLVAAGIDGVADSCAAMIAPDLNTAPIPAGHERKKASEAQIRALIGQLLDETDETAAARQMVLTERCLLMEKLVSGSGTSWVMRPEMKQVFAEVLPALDILGHARAAPSAGALPKATGQVGAASPNPPRLAGFSYWASRGYFNRLPRTRFTVHLAHRQAAISLAVQLYRFHHSAWPVNLAALVPEYLPAVPTDPTALVTAPIGYAILPKALPDGSDRPVLYSASALKRPDGTFWPGTIPQEPNFGTSEGASVIDLSRWAPEPKP